MKDHQRGRDLPLSEGLIHSVEFSRVHTLEIKANVECIWDYRF